VAQLRKLSKDIRWKANDDLSIREAREEGRTWQTKVCELR